MIVEDCRSRTTFVRYLNGGEMFMYNNNYYIRTADFITPNHLITAVAVNDGELVEINRDTEVICCNGKIVVEN